MKLKLPTGRITKMELEVREKGGKDDFFILTSNGNVLFEIDLETLREVGPTTSKTIILWPFFTQENPFYNSPVMASTLTSSVPFSLITCDIDGPGEVSCLSLFRYKRFIRLQAKDLENVQDFLPIGVRKGAGSLDALWVKGERIHIEDGIEGLEEEVLERKSPVVLECRDLYLQGPVGTGSELWLKYTR